MVEAPHAASAGVVGTTLGVAAEGGADGEGAPAGGRGTRGERAGEAPDGITEPASGASAEVRGLSDRLVGRLVGRLLPTGILTCIACGPER